MLIEFIIFVCFLSPFVWLATRPESKDPSEAQCPVCGYYCMGKGGFGCIDKPTLNGFIKTPTASQMIAETQKLNDENLKKLEESNEAAFRKLGEKTDRLFNPFKKLPERARCGVNWTEYEDEVLLQAVKLGYSVEDIASRHRRAFNGISSRIKLHKRGIRPTYSKHNSRLSELRLTR